MNIILFIPEMIGIAAFAVSGAVTGIRKKFDLFGILALGAITALGGGVTRDILLGHLPPRMFHNYRYLTLTAIVSAIVFLSYKLNTRKREGQGILNKALVSKTTLALINIFDAIGLATFTITGCGYAIEAGFGNNFFLVVFLGTMTGVGGGVLRDILSASVPLIFRKEVYATASIAGGIAYFLLYNSISQTYAVIIGASIILIIRFTAIFFRWGLPKA